MKTLGAVLALGIVVFAMGDVAGNDEAPPEPRLTLTIALYKARLLVAEPLLIDLRLVNQTAQPVKCSCRDNESFAGAGFWFSITDEDGREVSQDAPWGSAAPLPVPLLWPLMAPGEFRRCEKMLRPALNIDTAGRVPPLLPAGRYKLKVAKTTIDSCGESNTVAFEVIDPPEAEQAAAKLVSTPEAGALLSGLTRVKPKEVEELLARFPQSVYVPYARGRWILGGIRRFLGTRHPHTISDAEKEELRALLTEGAAYVGTFPDMPLSDNIMLVCARGHRLLGEEDSCVKRIEELLRKYPDGDAQDTAVRDLKRMNMRVAADGSIVRDEQQPEH